MSSKKMPLDRRLSVGMHDQLFARLTRLTKKHLGKLAGPSMDCRGSECDARQALVRRILDEGSRALEVAVANDRAAETPLGVFRFSASLAEQLGKPKPPALATQVPALLSAPEAREKALCAAVRGVWMRVNGVLLSKMTAIQIASAEEELSVMNGPRTAEASTGRPKRQRASAAVRELIAEVIAAENQRAQTGKRDPQT